MHQGRGQRACHTWCSYIYARGTLDVKYSVSALLEAAAAALEAGYSPRRTLLIALGHDEEVRRTCRGSKHTSATYLAAWMPFCFEAIDDHVLVYSWGRRAG